MFLRESQSRPTGERQLSSVGVSLVASTMIRRGLIAAAFQIAESDGSL